MVTHWNISEENWCLLCGTVWFNQYSQVDRNARSQACMFLFTIPIVLYRRFHLTCARCSGYASVPKLTSGSIYTYMDKYLVENKKILVSERRRNIARTDHRQGWTWRNNRPWHFGPLHSFSKTTHLCATLIMYTNSKSYNDFKKKERNRQRCALSVMGWSDKIIWDVSAQKVCGPSGKLSGLPDGLSAPHHHCVDLAARQEFKDLILC